MGLLFAALFPSIPALAIAWIVANGAGNLLYAALTFVLPDRVPEQQRGTASALVGLAAPVGQVAGLLLVTTILQHTGQSLTAAYIALIALVIVSGIRAFLHARARGSVGLAVYGALTGLSALGALFVGILLAG